MIRVTEAFEWKTNQSNEDVLLSSRAHLVGGITASIYVAESFSVETIPYTKGIPFAVHRPHEYVVFVRCENFSHTRLLINRNISISAYFRFYS